MCFCRIRVFFHVISDRSSAWITCKTDWTGNFDQIHFSLGKKNRESAEGSIKGAFGPKAFHEFFFDFRFLPFFRLNFHVLFIFLQTETLCYTALLICSLLYENI